MFGQTNFASFYRLLRQTILIFCLKTRNMRARVNGTSKYFVRIIIVRHQHKQKKNIREQSQEEGQFGRDKHLFRCLKFLTGQKLKQSSFTNNGAYRVSQEFTKNGRNFAIYLMPQCTIMIVYPTYKKIYHLNVALMGDAARVIHLLETNDRVTRLLGAC